MTPELCKVCGTRLYSKPAERNYARLCPRHLREALAATPPFVDGSRVTAGTEGCHCDENGRMCEFPCWQRLGLTDEPCCPDCAPLEAPEPEPCADVVPIHGALLTSERGPDA